MLAVAVPAPLRPTLLAIHNCTRQHANLLVPGQMVSGLVMYMIGKLILLLVSVSLVLIYRHVSKFKHLCVDHMSTRFPANRLQII
jgi:hypothetical protein